MADPLSIAASIIAVVGATGRTYQGVQQTWELRHRDQDFDGFKTQFKTLSTQLHLVELSVNALPDNADVFQGCLKDIDELCLRARCLFGELAESVKLVEQKSKKSDNGPKPGKRAWMKHKSTLTKLSSQATILVSSLASAVNMLNTFRVSLVSSESLQLMRSGFAVQNISVVQSPGNVNGHIASSCTSHQTLDLQLDSTAGQLTTTNSGKGPSVIGDGPNASIPGRALPAPATSGLVRITGVIGARKCDGLCGCQCHITREMRTPEWARDLIGSITMRGNASMLLNRYPCSQDSCKRSGTTSLSLSYIAPAWTFLRSFGLQLQTRNLGASYAMSIRMPRLVSNQATIWELIGSNDLHGLRQLIKRGEASAFDATSWGYSVLHYAAETLRYDIYAYLCSEGGDESSGADIGYPAYQSGLDRYFSSSLTSEREAAYALFIHDWTIDEQQFSTLHRIVLGLHGTDLQSCLDQIEYSPDISDAKGRTPLLWAAWRGNLAQVKLLLGAGADVNKTDNQGCSPLIKAANMGHQACLQYLLQAKANPNTADSGGRQAIHLAAQLYQGVPMIYDLVKAGASVHAQSSHGTPLHYAARYGGPDTVGYLLSLGASVDTSDYLGCTPAMAARQCGKTYVHQILITARPQPAIVEVEETSTGSVCESEEKVDASLGRSSQNLLDVLQSHDTSILLFTYLVTTMILFLI